jgi:hypothetical protein
MQNLTDLISGHKKPCDNSQHETLQPATLKHRSLNQETLKQKTKVPAT